MPMGDMTYTIIKLGDRGIGGLMKKPMPERRPAWLSYVSVKDADAVAATAKAEGGTVVVPPTDIPNVGRFTVFVDFAGAAMAALKGDGEQPLPESPRCTSSAGRRSRPPTWARRSVLRRRCSAGRRSRARQAT